MEWPYVDLCEDCDDCCRYTGPNLPTLGLTTGTCITQEIFEIIIIRIRDCKECCDRNING